MRKTTNLIAIFLLFSLVGALTSCMNNDDSVWEQYRDWREYNQNWLNEQIVRTNDDGTAYYTRCAMPTDPLAYIYMHPIEEAHSGLKPLYTSTTKVNYTLTLANDSVLDRGTNFVGQLSSQTLITGWGLAIMQMEVGDSAQFLLPYNVAYGSAGTSNIPPYTNLQFNIRLVDITGYEILP